MKAILSAAWILLLTGMPVMGHRLDEYLQATLITVEKDRVHATIRLIPGVAVMPIVLGAIDADSDGSISEAEQRGYAGRVLRDLSLTLDGNRLRPRLVSMRFPAVDEMKQGLGEIQLEFETNVPSGGSKRRLVFENHHQSAIAAYLVNCLVPDDPDIRITGQNRNYLQSFYELDYAQTGSRAIPPYFAWVSGGGVWLGAVALLLSARLAYLWRREMISIEGEITK